MRNGTADLGATKEYPDTKERERRKHNTASPLEYGGTTRRAPGQPAERQRHGSEPEEDVKRDRALQPKRVPHAISKPVDERGPGAEVEAGIVNAGVDRRDEAQDCSPE